MKKFLLLICVFVYSFSSSLNQEFLEPNEAFKPAFTKNEDSLNFKLDLGRDIYLYDDKLKVFITKPEKNRDYKRYKYSKTCCLSRVYSSV